MVSRHIARVRNAHSAVTVTSLEIGSLLGGNMVIESIFDGAGMGRLVVDGIFSRDYSRCRSVMVYY